MPSSPLFCGQKVCYKGGAENNPLDPLAITSGEERVEYEKERSGKIPYVRRLLDAMNHRSLRKKYPVRIGAAYIDAD